MRLFYVGVGNTFTFSLLLIHLPHRVPFMMNNAGQHFKYFIYRWVFFLVKS